MQYNFYFQLKWIDIPSKCLIQNYRWLTDLSEQNTITECKSHHKTVTNIIYIYIYTDTCSVQYNMNTVKVVLDHTIYIKSNVKTSEYTEEINYSSDR